MLMKDGLNAASAERIAGAVSQVYPSFATKEFLQQIEQGLSPLELKERVNHFIDVLAKHLPTDFADCHKILIQLKPHWDHGDPEDPLRSFAAWPITDFNSSSVNDINNSNPSTSVLCVKPNAKKRGV